MRPLRGLQYTKASTRFLVISGVAIGVLVMVAVVLVLIVGDGGSTTLLPEDTPEGVVQRFLLALEAEDYEEAYGYLHSSARAERSYLSWVSPLRWYEEQPGWKATLGESLVEGNEAIVEVNYTRFYPSAPLVDPVFNHKIIFRLQKEGVSWGITSPNWLSFLFY